MIHRFESLEAACRSLARRVGEEAAEAIGARGMFRLALSGGSTPEPLYRMLGVPPQRDAIDWSRVVVLFVDERAVPPADPESNYGLVHRTLLEPLGSRAPNVRRMRGEADDLAAAALEYEAEVATPVDLAVLGIGQDGHIASLFPGHAAVSERQRRVLAIRDSPKPPPSRLTLTPRALVEARSAAVLCAGADKAPAVARALRDRPTPRECPAVLVQDRDWYLDVAAAAGLAEH